jgi:hypothetical protein
VGRVVSRFPELRRIESAIANKHAPDLRWALAYCESRLSSSTMRQHQNHWHALIARVQAALDASHETERPPDSAQEPNRGSTTPREHRPVADDPRSGWPRHDVSEH